MRCLYPGCGSLCWWLWPLSHGNRNAFQGGISAVSSECNQRLGRTGSHDRGVAQTTEMLLVHAQLGMKEGQGTPQDLSWAATGPTLHTSAGQYKGSATSKGHHHQWPRKETWGVYMSNGRFLLPCCTYPDYGIWIGGEAWYTKTSGKGCLDGYALSTVPQTYLWSCRSYLLTTKNGGCIQIYLIQAVTLPLCW